MGSSVSTQVRSAEADVREIQRYIPYLIPSYEVYLRQFDALLSLKPGQSADFAFFNVAFLADPKTMPRQLSRLNEDYSFHSNLDSVYRWSIDKKYHDESLKSSDYTLVATVAGEYHSSRSKGPSGSLHAITMARNYGRDGIYLMLAGTAQALRTVGMDEVPIKIRLAQILNLILMCYLAELGRKHIYIHATPAAVTTWYRTGFEFCTDDFTEAITIPPEKLARLRDPSQLEGIGYPMRLMNYDIETVRASLRDHVTDILKEVRMPLIGGLMLS